MRNLKRALSLGLTAAMISGLMVMGSSAAGYADVTSENNQEAIEVLQAVGVMVGDENGDFNPDQNVTRNEMAVVMSNLMDYTVASYKGTSPFTDVPEWAEPYVSACYTNGITSGTSATTYGGNSTVTTGQAALMLLKALGYFQYQADYGSDWLVEATKQGSIAGLFDGVSTGATEALTRNDVAQMVLNALEADLVNADKNGSDVQVGDIIISGGKATYTARTSTETKYREINNTMVDGRYTIQLGEDLYDGDLEKDSADDDFGRPATKWTYDNQEVGTYADAADGVYTAAVAKEDLYDLVGRTVYNNLGDGKDDRTFTVFVDGVDQDADLADYIVRNDDDDALNTKKGATTEVYISDEGDVTIAIINTYVAQVDGDYDEDDEELNLEVLDNAEFDADSYTLSADDFDYLDTYEDEDYVLVTVADGEIKTIAPAEVLTGEITSYTINKRVAVDGTRYDYSKNYTYEGGYTVGDEYTVVLDNNGYVVYTDATGTSNEDYVYIAKASWTSGVKGNLEADAYFIDGTNEVIVIDNDDEYDDDAKGWYAYDEKSNGKFELDEITEEDVYTGTVDETVTTNGSSRVYVNDTVNEKETVRANSNTIFVVNEDDDVTVYTGIKSVPDISGTGVTVAVVMDGSNADVVYIEADKLSISGDSSDRVYILEFYEASTDADDNDYYVYDAIVNGKIGQIETTADNLEEGALYADFSYDADGYADIDKSDKVEGTGDEDYKAYDVNSVISYSGGVLTFGDVDVVLADDCTIFGNDDGDGKTITASKLDRDYDEENPYNGIIYVYENDDDEAVEIYVDITK